MGLQRQEGIHRKMESKGLVNKWFAEPHRNNGTQNRLCRVSPSTPIPDSLQIYLVIALFWNRFSKFFYAIRGNVRISFFVF